MKSIGCAVFTEHQLYVKQ